MSGVLAFAMGLSFFGIPGAVSGVLGLAALRLRPVRQAPLQMRPVLIALLVEIRSGKSVLSSLQHVAGRFPESAELGRAVRLATVSGLPIALQETAGPLRVLLAHLARSQAGGLSAADVVRRMIESDIARDRAARIARARALPVRLMFPVTLLILPGVVLLSYGPTLLSLLDRLAVPLG